MPELKVSEGAEIDTTPPTLRILTKVSLSPYTSVESFVILLAFAPDESVRRWPL